MRIQRTSHTAEPADHARLVSYLTAAAERADGGLKEHMRLGVRNESGDIYLVIETEAVGEFLNVIAALSHMDYLDELIGRPRPFEGFYAVFQRG
jgi:hypothetical protein